MALHTTQEFTKECVVLAILLYEDSLTGRDAVEASTFMPSAAPRDVCRCGLGVLDLRPEDVVCPTEGRPEVRQSDGAPSRQECTPLPATPSHTIDLPTFPASAPRYVASHINDPCKSANRVRFLQ